MKKLVMVLLVGMGFGAFAQKPAVVADNEAGWTHIGQVTANFKTTNESIVVLGADEFQAIKLKVNDAPIHIERVQVFYESGQMEELEVKSDLRENSETRVINLSNPDRDIKKVAFTYRTLPNATSQKADVALYGLKTGAEGDAYRDEVKDAKREARQEAREIKQDAREVKQEAKEEAHEMKHEANEETNEVRKDANNADEVMKSEAKDAENAVSEAAAKAAAAITDKKYDTKVGPDGQTVYIDDDGKYYYISEEGKKIYVTKLQLKDKPNND